MKRFKYDPKLAANILMHDCPGMLTREQAEAIANLAGMLDKSRQSRNNNSINQQNQTL
jgi:hypothetical protein